MVMHFHCFNGSHKESLQKSPLSQLSIVRSAPKCYCKMGQVGNIMDVYSFFVAIYRLLDLAMSVPFEGVECDIFSS